MTHETTYSNARAHLAALMDQVTNTREPIVIRRRGAEPVALVAADELAGWMETAYLLRSPKNARRLLEASDRAEGEATRLDIDQLRERLGIEGA
ncbi:MAG: type II toxin-antitoxin system prevent-host-death family antitoxin [Spirochaetaceae bacterium]|nr:type II toxin-antitoxin system prevent-host-death family antitoxin [Spirochaetaceae bacterium]